MIKVKCRESFEHGIDYMLAGLKFAGSTDSSVIYRFAKERGIDLKCMRESITAMEKYFEIMLMDGRKAGWHGVFEFEDNA